jgi:hypothetical protein
MSKQWLVTLQRPPPEMRTFARNLLLFSSKIISVEGHCAAILIAQKKPAAPPPIITTGPVIKISG